MTDKTPKQKQNKSSFPAPARLQMAHRFGQFSNFVIPAHAGIRSLFTMSKTFYVYILASQRNGTLYTGVTSNLVQRIWQHKNAQMEGFTQKYEVKQLVYFERHATAENAITREKQIKKWKRTWKLELIEKENPQ
jgi:putative endonuclease